MEYGFVFEVWGGEIIFVLFFVLIGKGIDEFVEMILFVSEVEELKVNLNCQVKGMVIEVEFDKGRGLVVILFV